MRKLPRLSLTRLTMLAAAMVVGYLLFSLAGDVLLSNRLSAEEQHTRNQIAELERQERELTVMRERLQSDSYVEGVARRVLGLVRPGETLVIVSSSVTPTPTATPSTGDDEARPWWEETDGP
ncbi:MAG: septum formation initiator family protein [Dehalococcoidia bacterium]